MLNHPGHAPYHMDFFEIFASGRYHRDMEIQKILALTPSGSDFTAFLKDDKLMKEGEPGQILHFLDNFCLK